MFFMGSRFFQCLKPVVRNLTRNSFVHGLIVGVLVSGLGGLLYSNRHENRQVSGAFKAEPISNATIPRGPRVLCMICTYPTNYKTKALHVAATWARRCDKVVFLSSSDGSPAPSLEVEKGKQLELVEVAAGLGRKHLWRRIKLGLIRMWELYKDEFDFLVKADDDTYIVMENLKRKLELYNPRTRLIFGHYQRDQNMSYMSGGSGYVLSNEGVKAIVKEGLSGDAPCTLPYPFERQITLSEDEDLQLGACAALLKFQFVPSDSEGKTTFFPFKIEEHIIPDLINSWWKSHSLECRKANFAHCASVFPVSFHYVSPAEMYRLEYLLYVARVQSTRTEQKLT